MKNITIVIPTRHRIQKLKKTLESLQPICWSKNVEVIIGCDNDEDTFKWLCYVYKEYTITGFRNFDNKKNDKPLGAVYIRNELIQKCVNDGLIYATDDIVFEKNSIKNAKECFNDNFKDEDGIVGFVQKPSNQFHPTGVGLVGQKFLQRYPNKWLFHPKYKHFSCQEIYWLANKYDKFVQCKDAIVWHYNPCKFEKEMDKTHEDARIYKEQDHKLIKERKRKGLIWGDNDKS